MSRLRALQPYYVTGVSSFQATPGFFYRVDTSAGLVTAELCSTLACQGGDWLMLKNVGTNGNNLTVAAFVDSIAGYQELINGNATQTGIGNGTAHVFLPFALSAAYSSTRNGWTSW